MNNWRLLLLAIVAVFQPIASFTDRNLIDGRQQCCDHLSSAPLQDTKSSLHGTNRLGKTTPVLRRLNDQDEIREDRRYELSQRDSIFSRPSTERPLVDIRGRVARQGPSEIARSSRVEYRLERLTNPESRERLLHAHRREDTARSIRDLKTQDLTRRVVDRTSRDALERRNDGVYTDSSRDRFFRDSYRTERFGNERLSNNLFDSQREMQREQFRSVERRITLNRDARRVLSRTKDVPSIETSDNMNNLQRFTRERLSVVRRESSVRPDTSRYSERNNERRVLYRNNEQRRSLSENTRLVDQIRDMRIRLNARGDNRENRLSNPSERIQERREQREDRRESRQQNKENIDHRASGDRMQVAQRMTRESRITNTQNEKDVDVQREIKHDRMLRETRDENRVNLEQRLSAEKIQMARRNIRDSSNTNTQNVRNIDIRRDIRHSERLSRTTRDENRVNQEQRLSSERIQMDRRNTREARIMNAQNKRNIDDRREIRHNERMLRETREEIRDNIRDNLEQRLSRDRTQVDRRDTRESRNTNTQNVHDRREIKNSERISRNTRDERENHINRLSLERAQVDQRNIREFRVIDNLIARDDDRRIGSRRETRNNNRMSRETRDENRLTPDHRLSLERIQMERRIVREFRIVNTPNDKDIDNRREIRYYERSTEVRKEARLNPEQRISRERIQLDRRNIRKFRNMDFAVRTERDFESKREIRTDARLNSENRENSNHRLSHERIQMDRRNSRESSRQDIRYNDRLSREIRGELRENSDRGLSRASRQVDRRNIRESRLNRVATRNDKNLETETESRREIRYNERLSGQIRGDQFISERRVESRSADRINDEQRQSVMMDRRARSDDRRNFRGIRAEPRLSQSADSQRRSEVIRSGVERSHTIDNRARETIDKRSLNVEMAQNRQKISSVMVGKMETENDFTVSNWQYVLYTLQAAYLCAIFMQMLTPSRTEKPQKRSLRWLPVSSYYNPIKVD